MKKIILFVLTLLYLLPLKSQDSILIGLSLAYLRDRWYKDVEYLTKSTSELGTKLLIEEANGDAETQKSQILSLINSGVKVMVIIPADAESLNESVEACKKANIKVIAYDRLIKNCDIDYFISFDAEKIGELQAGYVTKISPKGNYVLLAGPTRDNNAVNFLKGQKKVLEPYLNNKSINIIYEKNMIEWDRMDAFLEVSALIESGTDIAAIIASNDELASGAIMAIETNEKYKNVPITGQDATLEACNYILAGKQAMTIYKSIRLLAHTTASMALKLAQGEAIEDIKSKIDNGNKMVPTILLEPVAVDKTNFNETVIKDGYYTRAEIFGE
jgi:D-xylose transport system substrate-binding protein